MGYDDGIMSWPDSPSPREAARHCRRWQWAIVAPAIPLIVLLVAAEPFLDGWIFVDGISSTVAVILVVLSVSIGVYTSWSAVWIVFGSGNWLSRVGMTLAIFHIAGIAILLGLAFLQWIQDDLGSDGWVRDYVALLAGGSYAFALHLAASMFLVWLMKLNRYRLVFFADSGLYPHPRRIARTIPPEERSGVVALKGRARLLDLFGLTTLVAVYLGSIYPLQQVLDDDRMFGASFTFVVAAYLMGINAVIAIPAFLLPITAGLIDHRGVVFQLVVNAIVLASACVAAILSNRAFANDPDMTEFIAAEWIALVLFQLTLAVLLHRPKNQLRFRLVRTK